MILNQILPKLIVFVSVCKEKKNKQFSNAFIRLKVKLFPRNQICLGHFENNTEYLKMVTLILTHLTLIKSRNVAKKPYNKFKKMFNVYQFDH